MKIKKRHILFYFISLFVTFYTSTYANGEDSLNYLLLREKIVSKYLTKEVLLTSDELANAGLYKEAIELLTEFEKKETEKYKPNLSSKNITFTKKTKFRVSSGIDYYHLEDIDTAVMTPEELKEYKRLTETPLSIWQRTSSNFTFLFDSNFITSFSPELYNSQRKSFISLNTDLSLPYNIYIKPEITLQKWHYTDSSFEFTKPLPSDMIGGILKIGQEKKYNEKTKYSIPFTLNIENYRYDSPGYESYVEYRLSPSLDLWANNTNLQTRLSVDLQYENYFKTESDTLDVIRSLAGVEGIINIKNCKINIIIRGFRDYYIKSFLNTIDRIESSIKIENIPKGKVRQGIKLKAIYEKEKYGKNINSLLVKGIEFTTKPYVEFFLFDKRFKNGIDVLLEKRFSDNTIPYIWESRSAVEPAIVVGWNSYFCDISLRTAYRYENIEDFFEVFTPDNRSFKGNIEISLVPFSFLSINLFTDYQYRLYSNFTPSSRVSENLTLSFNVSLKF